MIMRPLSFSNIRSLQSESRLQICRRSTQQQQRLMVEKQSHSSGVSESTAAIKFSPVVDKMQQLVSDDPIGGWKRCWEEGLTPWDLGKPTPILQYLHQTGSLPMGRALVPGCGSGNDVVTLACPERYVIGLDLSDIAIRKARELSLSSPQANYCSFQKADFFTWHPFELFDLIIDYTFFCAIEPNMRSSWASRMRDLLKLDGELVTIMFPIDDHSGGPPYKTSVADYEDVLHPMGFQAILIKHNELAVERRKGREMLGRWKRMAKTQSSL
ncbi:hypothetical protein Nepgr_029883 [Nepenthes gracilis]|uniref:Thiol methyltransferase 2 n=1 Tax=Nepenthes gracilis TaxID=150966 RepID=A0AAD3TDH5_NEPGR|nr:hypothetical protein Nepgr_029883 [Nepenthes gracilis]